MRPETKIVKIGRYRKHVMIFVITSIIAALVCSYDAGFLSYIISSTYVKLTGTDKRITIDNKGIPFVDYRGYIGKQRNPTTTSLKSFVYWEQYMPGDENNPKEYFLNRDWEQYMSEDENPREYFLNCADWLVQNATPYEGYTVWEYEFPWKSYGMTPPWRSALAQGLGIQVLTRAYEATGSQCYLDAAKLALQSFYVEVDKGGVAIKEVDGWWFEEYADEGGKNPKVLNGMLFTLLGIHEYYERVGDFDAKFLFDKGIISLENHLPEYDTGYWSRYDRTGVLAKRKYHHIHVVQLAQLSDITKSPILKNYHDKWYRYESRPSPWQFWLLARQMGPWLSMAVYAVNFLALFTFFELGLFLLGRKGVFKGSK